jgi:hypothetical protein
MLETINKLYLELSHVTTAKTAREIELEQKIESLEREIATIKGYLNPKSFDSIIPIIDYDGRSNEEIV